MPFINPTREQFKTIYGIPDGQPISMLNILRFHEQARYEQPEGSTIPQAISGREAYEKYSAAAQLVFQKVGGHQTWIGQPQGIIIGSGDEAWDLAFVAFYPTAQAFAEMVKSEEYQRAAKHRTAAVADSRLIVCAPLRAGSSFAPAEYLATR